MDTAGFAIVCESIQLGPRQIFQLFFGDGGFGVITGVFVGFLEEGLVALGFGIGVVEDAGEGGFVGGYAAL
jgi:hypothetical protein